MPESPAQTTSDAVLPAPHGRHYAFIEKAIPRHLIDAPPTTRAALRQTQARLHDWYVAATQAQKNALKPLLQDQLRTQKRLDETFAQLQPLNDFAQPLLEDALKTQGYSLAVNEVYLRLYVPAFDAFGVSTGGFSSRTLSLLQAALHNFEQPETEAGYFGSGSGFITRPDNLGRFEPYLTSLGIETFASLCRQLDIGAKYQAHLQLYLNPPDLMSPAGLHSRYLAQQKAMLKVDAQIALLKGDIDTSVHDLLNRAINDEREIKTAEQQVWYRYPCVMGLVLFGCVVFDLCVKYQYCDSMVVWIPGDPEHPLKQYASYFDFRDELQRKMTPAPSSSRQTGLTPYQQFLSRFIAQKDRPYYYKRLTELVKDAPEQPWGIEWFRSEKVQLLFRLVSPLRSLLVSIPPNPQVHTRRVQAQHPSIQVEICSMTADRIWVDIDPWEQQFQDMREQAFAGARNMAIPTADADANNRAARLSHFLNIGLFAVNLVSMAVPPLGDVMMVVMIGQLLYETIEGIEEWAEGDTELAWRHIGDVLENLATLAAGAAVIHGVVVPAIEKLKVVTLPGGMQKLWNADLAPYERNLAIPPHVKPDAAGLYPVNGQQVLLHEGKAYVLNKDPVSEQYHVVHPGRPEAYQPRFRHNGHGVWVHEGEQPATWGRLTLMRRLGLSVEGLSNNELKQILRISGIHDDSLRRMYAENEPTPVLLSDTIRSYNAYSKAMRAVQEVSTGRLSNELCSYAATFTVELPGWPSGMAIELYDSRPSPIPMTRYGNASAVGAEVISISRAELMNGELAGRVVDALNQQQLEGLLGERLPFAREGRLQLFKEVLLELMGKNPRRLFTSLYEEPLMAHDPVHLPVELIKRLFPKLPSTAARRLIAEASTAERAQLDNGKVPPSMMQAARSLQRDARLSAAYRGLYLSGLATIDTERLVLNTLDHLPGWQDQLRLEIRADSDTGELRASYGAVDAHHRKVLVRVADGRYRAYDDVGNELHGSDDLYASLQHALPDRHRAALKLPHVWQGATLKARIQKHALPRERLREMLHIKRDSHPVFLAPQRLAGGRAGYPLSGRGALRPGQSLGQNLLKDRVSQLYPSYTEADIQAFFGRHPTSALTRIAALERELAGLDEALGSWARAPASGSHVTQALRRELRARQTVHERLLRAWRRTGPTQVSIASGYEGQSLDLMIDDLGSALDTLPALAADFSHVSQLSLWHLGGATGIDGFMSRFRELRVLQINQSALAMLPSAIGRMPHLQVLDLRASAIVLTPQAVARLRTLTQLRILFLDQCPLGLAPDISRMPYLRTLSLKNCALDRWPTGLFAHPRGRAFRLMLEHNPLEHIPDVAPGSDKAGTVARTALTRSVVLDEVLARYDLYSESVGIDRQRQRPPGLERGSHQWLTGFRPQETILKQGLWNRVEEAVGSEPFFNVLSDQAHNLDHRGFGFKEDLQDKLWRMLEAMDESAALRDKLFEMASAPFTCVDAGAQLFNAMGVEVLVYEAYSFARSPFVELDILEVAKGKARLDELGRIARARVLELEALGRQHPQYDANGIRIRQLDANGRTLRDIDEAGIYLAYTTELANSLNLPWQFHEMMFPEPDVTQAMTQSASQRVRGLEEGEGMRNQLLDQTIWLDYLQGAYAAQLETVRKKMTALTDLLTAQRAWVDEPDLTAQQRVDLRETIETAAQLLGKSARQIAPGGVMSSEAYDADMRELDAQQRQVLERLTDEALGSSQPSWSRLYGQGSSMSE